MRWWLLLCGVGAGCGSSPSAPAASPPVVDLSAPSPAPVSRETPAPTWDGGMPETTDAVAAYLDAVCTHLAAADEAWLTRFTRRPIVGHEPFTNAAGTHTWRSASALTPTDPRWAEDAVPELCQRNREVTRIERDGPRLDATLRIDGHDFILVARDEGGRPVLERLSMRVVPREGFPRDVATHATEVLGRAEPGTPSSFGRDVARAVRNTGCWTSFIAREEGRGEPDLASVMVQVAADERGLSLVADGIVPRAVLSCLHQKLAPAFLTTYATAPDAPQVTPWARLSLLVTLEASEIPDGADAVVGPSGP